MVITEIIFTSSQQYSNHRTLPSLKLHARDSFDPDDKEVGIFIHIQFSLKFIYSILIILLAVLQFVKAEEAIEFRRERFGGGSEILRRIDRSTKSLKFSGCTFLFFS